MTRGHDITLPDGRVVNSYSEEYRCHCEAKWVFKRFRNKNTRRQYLMEVYKIRGEKGYQQLYDEMMRIHLHKKGEVK